MVETIMYGIGLMAALYVVGYLIVDIIQYFLRLGRDISEINDFIQEYRNGKSQ